MFTWRFTGYGRSHGVVTPSFLRVKEGTRYKNKKTNRGKKHSTSSLTARKKALFKKITRLRNKKSKPFPTEHCLIQRIKDVTY